MHVSCQRHCTLLCYHYTTLINVNIRICNYYNKLRKHFKKAFDNKRKNILSIWITYFGKYSSNTMLGTFVSKESIEIYIIKKQQIFTNTKLTIYYKKLPSKITKSRMYISIHKYTKYSPIDNEYENRNAY